MVYLFYATGKLLISLRRLRLFPVVLNAGALFNMKKRVSVYIDGANFYGGISNLSNRFVDEKFDFEKYVKKIVGEDDLINVYYYNGYSKKKISSYIWNKQNRLFNRLRKLKKWKVILFRKQECLSDGGKIIFKLKEDDISLAVDSLSDAYDDKFDKMIFVSSDRDFVPLIKKMKNLNKDIGICYFQDCISKSLLNLFEEKNEITKSVVRKYFLRGKE